MPAVPGFWGRIVPFADVGRHSSGSVTVAPQFGARPLMLGDTTADLVVAPDVVIPAAELRWQFSRAGGAGGQHVNTASSRVQLSWDLAASGALDPAQRARARRRLGARLSDGVLTVAASERRSQLRNRDLARARLAEVVAAAIAPPPPRRRATAPTGASERRRLEAKRARGHTKRLRGPVDDR
jgi:ribosome-associated protein